MILVGLSIKRISRQVAPDLEIQRQENSWEQVLLPRRARLEEVRGILMATKLIRISFSVLFFLFCDLVRADIVRTDFSGTLTDEFGTLQSEFGGLFEVGTAFSGRYVYDTELSSFSKFPDTAFYDGFSEFSLTIGALSWSAAVAFGEVTDGGNGGSVDAFGVRTGAEGGPIQIAVGPTVAGKALREYQLHFRDETANALASTALPGDVIDLTDFARAIITLQFFPLAQGPTIAVRGVISDVSGVVIATRPTIDPDPVNLPEPRTLALVGAMPLS